MYDYMRALRQRFDTPLECEKLQQDLERAHEKLHSQLDGQGRKLLLRLTDLENAMRDEASLHSFISGYRMACGIQRELSTQPRYSLQSVFCQAQGRVPVMNDPKSAPP